MGEIFVKPNVAEVDFGALAEADFKAQALAALADTTQTRRVGQIQSFQKAITSAANAGDVTVATVTTAACKIKSITVKAVTAVQTDLTNIGVYAGASKVITLIDPIDGVKANIDAVDEQVSESNLEVELAAAKTIVITLTGTGATAVNLLVTIEYVACVANGYLA